MFITKKSISRRAVLKGAGVALGLPLLDAMIPAFASDIKRPPKLGFIYFPHGALDINWRPQGTGKNFQLSNDLKPLEHYKDYLTVVSSLRNRAGEDSQPHANKAKTWLTCINPQQGLGVSADQIAAKVLCNDTPLTSLELTLEPGDTTAYRTPTLPLPMDENPRKVFQQMFGAGDNYNQRLDILHENVSLLDYILPAAKQLSKVVGKNDQNILDGYLTSVSDLERRIKIAGNKIDPNIPNAPSGTPDDFGEHGKLMFDLMVLAWQHDLTRVGSIMMAKEATMRVFANLDIEEAFHPLSHHGNLPDKIALLGTIQNYLSQMLFGFVDKLANTPDGDGSLLDHSMILFGSNIGNSDVHDSSNLPNLVIGKGNGALNSGQHIDCVRDTPHSNLVLTILNKAGVNIDHHADSTGIIQGM